MWSLEIGLNREAFEHVGTTSLVTTYISSAGVSESDAAGISDIVAVEYPCINVQVVSMTNAAPHTWFCLGT